MVIIFAIIQLLVIGLICIFEVNRKSSACFLWATLMLMFGLMHFISCLLESNQYSDIVLCEAAGFVILFCIVYFIVRILLVKLIKTDSNRTYIELSNGKGSFDKNSKWLYVVFYFVCFLLCYEIIKYSGGILNTSWESLRIQSSQKNYVNLGQLQTILFYSLGGLNCISLINHDRKQIFGTFLVIGALVLITRNRMYIIPILVGCIASFIFRIKKIKISYIAYAMLAAVAIIFVLYGLRAIRYYGTIGDLLNNFDITRFMNLIKIFIVNDDGELGLRQWFYYFIQQDNNFENFNEGHTYIRMLLVYLPTRFTFGIKPEDFAITMGSAIGMAEGGSMHPTLFGDCYANFGWFGIFLGALWACFVSFADYITNKFKKSEYKVLSYVLFASMYILIGRGAVYNAFFNIAWGVPILYVLRFCDKHRIKFRITWGSR